MDSSNATTFACTLNNSIELSPSFFWTESEKLIILVIMPLITIIGNAGNLAFLFTIFRVPRMRTVANAYLATVAVVDINFVSVVCITYGLAYLASPDIRANPQRGVAGCLLVYFQSFSCYFMSMVVITLLSLERYYAICYPIKHRLFAHRSRTIKQLTISILIGMVCGAVSTIKWGDYNIIKFCVKPVNDGPVFEPYPLIIHTCQLRNGRALASLLSEALVTIVFLLAFFISSFMYAKVLKTLRQRSQSNLKSSTSIDKVHRQVSQMIIVNGIVFFTCQIPYRLYAIHDILADTFQVWSLPAHQRASLLIVGRIFLYFNSAINPYIYVVGSTFYRKAFMEAFGLCTSSKKTSNSSSSGGSNIISISGK
ncbi:thyrotropin-releasing hormone receptor-like [Amphiura filiformis]|uniref:thyrotropin-releasing hormone receptor-like n=1 Tax=Amphiura filiformis TaxID=82378 RepID=UPI003B21DBD0